MSIIELGNSIFPNLPDSLSWVYGIFYILTYGFILQLILSPLYAILRPIRRKRTF